MIKDYLCVALDTDDKEEILSIVDELKDVVGYFKLNFAFTRHGPGIINDIKNRGGKVFLDLKFHDIPNTVEGYARAVTAYGVDIFNVHSLGGKEMMAAALKGSEDEALKRKITRPMILAVTILTSVDNRIMNEELNILGDMDSQILRMAKLAEKSGLDGIVSSAADLERIRDELPKSFFFLTPGIKGASIGSDQKRVSTPGKAVEAGSSLLVVGRGILRAANRREAALKMQEEIKGFI